jgi:hypothetical protein
MAWPVDCDGAIELGNIRMFSSVSTSADGTKEIFVKRNYLAFIALVLLSGCDQPPREEVIERYEGGEKKIVAIYKGSGVDEQLIERRTYDPKGTTLLLENVTDGTITEWAELNDVGTPAGLAKWLQGEWSGTDYIGRSFAIEFDRNRLVINFLSEDKAETYLYSLQYLSNYRAKAHLADESGDPIHKKPDPDYVGPSQKLAAIEFVFQGPRSFQMLQITNIDSRIDLARSIGLFHRDAAYVEEHKKELSKEHLALKAERSKNYLLTLLKDGQLRDNYPEWHHDLVKGILVSREENRFMDEASEWWRTPYEERQANAKKTVENSGMTRDEMLSAAIEYEEGE